MKSLQSFISSLRHSTRVVLLVTGQQYRSLSNMAAANAEANMERFRGENHSAFVVGYSGATGKALVNDLNRFKIFKRVVLIGRRELPTLDVGPEFEQKVVNFDNLEEHSALFDNLDVGFCCLGSTTLNGGAEAYVKIDRDLVVAIASLAKTKGCKQFSLVSSVGVNPDSRFTAFRAKGEAIESVKDLSFDRSSIYKPGNLLAKREDFRLYEVVVNNLMKPIYCCFPTSMSISVEILARAIVNHVVEPMPQVAQSNVYSNKESHLASGMDTKCGR